MLKLINRIVAFAVIFCLVFEQSGFAQVAPAMNIPAYLNGLLGADKFRPMHMRWLSYDQMHNTFDLAVEKGDDAGIKEADIKKSTAKIMEYFQIGLRLPDSMFWVNLRPDAPDQVIDPYLARTDIGKVMLEADLQLKKDLARFTSPDTDAGREYWNKLYARAEQLFGAEDISIPAVTRPWIVPNEIIIKEYKDGAYVYKATMKVMLEQDYLKDAPGYNFDDPRLMEINEYSSELVRRLIIPQLTREVNSSKRYSGLRQVFYSMVLSQWFKQRYARREGNQNTELTNKIDSRDLSGLASMMAWSKDAYFNQYVKSFQKGEYNKQETVNGANGLTVRQYFSGGILWSLKQGAQSLMTIIPAVQAAQEPAILQALGGAQQYDLSINGADLRINVLQKQDLVPAAAEVIQPRLKPGLSKDGGNTKEITSVDWMKRARIWLVVQGIIGAASVGLGLVSLTYLLINYDVLSFVSLIASMGIGVYGFKATSKRFLDALDKSFDLRPGPEGDTVNKDGRIVEDEVSDKDGGESVDVLIQDLRSPDQAVVSRAVEQLSMSDDDRVVPVLGEFLLETAKRSQALGRNIMSVPEADHINLDRQTRQCVVLVQELIDGLALTRDVRASEYLLKAYEFDYPPLVFSPDGDGRIVGPVWVPSYWDLYIHARILRALGRTGGAQALDFLIELAQEGYGVGEERGHTAIPMTAIDGLVMIGDKKALPFIRSRARAPFMDRYVIEAETIIVESIRQREMLAAAGMPGLPVKVSIFGTIVELSQAEADYSVYDVTKLIFEAFVQKTYRTRAERMKEVEERDWMFHIEPRGGNVVYNFQEDVVFERLLISDKEISVIRKYIDERKKNIGILARLGVGSEARIEAIEQDVMERLAQANSAKDGGKAASIAGRSALVAGDMWFIGAVSIVCGVVVSVMLGNNDFAVYLIKSTFYAGIIKLIMYPLVAGAVISAVVTVKAFLEGRGNRKAYFMDKVKFFEVALASLSFIILEMVMLSYGDKSPNSILTLLASVPLLLAFLIPDLAVIAHLGHQAQEFRDAVYDRFAKGGQSGESEGDMSGKDGRIIEDEAEDIPAQEPASQERRDGGKIGGVDFRAMPAVVMPAAEVGGEVSSVAAVDVSELGRQWAALQVKVRDGQMPYDDIRAYISACCANKEACDSLKKASLWVAEILKMEEDACVATSPQMKEVIALL